MNRIIEYFRSPYRIEIAESDSRLVLDFLVANDIPFHDIQNEEGTFSFLLYTPYFKIYEKKRGDRRYRKEVRVQTGFQVLLSKYRKRKGLLVGFILSLALLIFSTLFVWDITIVGADRIPEGEILAALEEQGMKLGAFIPTLDKEKIERTIILEVDGISLISINLRGTVANVEIKERQTNPEIIDRTSPSNLVATADGQIEALEITGGVAAVALGDVVKKGDLLVSGVIDSTALGYRLVRARGEVTARTTLTYHIEIPFQTTEKVYTGDFHTKKSVKFFSKIIKLFGKDSISAPTCDKIEVERRLYLFDTVKLPIFLIETTYAEYEILPKTLTEEEALRAAYAKLREESEAALSDAEILSRHTDITMDETALYLDVQVECIIDITEEVKIGTGS